jgi:hypothetical protein
MNQSKNKKNGIHKDTGPVHNSTATKYLFLIVNLQYASEIPIPIDDDVPDG